MQRLLCGVLFFLALGCFAAAHDTYPDFHGDDYQGMARANKELALWDAVNQERQENGWYAAWQLVEMFVESMNTTMDTVADDMPKQYLSLITRKKLIHSVGVVAPFVWKSTGNHSYTGIFQGADKCMIRLSLAKEEDFFSEFPMAPGMAIKCLRDGIKSANVMAMFSLLGQNNTNFFSHDFTNHVPYPAGPKVPAALQALANAFGKASHWPTMLGVSDFAKYGADGKTVKNPRFPFRLVFHPTKAVHEMFPNDPEPEVSWLDQLESVPTGKLYEVYAQNSSLTHYMDLVKIGELWLTQTPTRSYFGDAKMFFAHQRLEDDVAFHPEWIPGVEAILKQQQNTDNFVFPDLPWKN
ncbi:hypothetical protein QOT17_008215 [Balamuthia mandrillaris]